MFSRVNRHWHSAGALKRKTGLAAFKSNQSGATAVEFGLVAFPFMLLTFMTINVGLFYFTVNSLDKGASDAVRSILTGTAQTSGLKVGDFRSLVCTQANLGGSAIDCSKLSVLMASSTTNWADLETKISAISCTSAGNLTAGTGNSTDLLSTYVNGNSAYVFVTLCYQWELSRYLPFWNFGSFSDGSMLIQSSLAFKTEPYS